MSKSTESRETVDSVVKQVSAIVSKTAGIKLGPRQSSMVEARLQNRMTKLGLDSFDAYLKYLNAHLEDESQALLSLITTHHTYFFREFSHFEFLINGGLKKIVDAVRARGDTTVRVWSAAASRGQEAYSLGMFLDHHLKILAPELRFEIWGTDVDPESINIAKNAVYRVSELNQVPTHYLSQHWVRGSGSVADFYKLRTPLRTKCHFQPMNLLKRDAFLTGRKFDLIFCRNVFIYFENEQIKQATNMMLDHLYPEGYLFLGVSETLNGLGIKVVTSGPSIYQHFQVGSVSKASAQASPIQASEEKKIQRVLCVDDSASILALLKKILVKDSGFEVVSVAKNGKEALELCNKIEVDVITLDLHMPVMDGLGFLSQYKGKAPVVVVSAINRDDMTVAQKAISLGASDYVEKPSLENIAQASNEIRAKLKTVITLKKSASSEAPANSDEREGKSSSSQSPSARAPSPTNPSTSNAQQKKIKVMIVDDSATIRQLLDKVISADPMLEVVAKVANPLQVEDQIKSLKPDVITLDIHMPEMDGVTLLKKLYPKYKIPTLMISSIAKESGSEVLDALEAGAVDYIQKPEMKNLQEVQQIILEKIKAASTSLNTKKIFARRANQNFERSSAGLILMGASTGGTEALRIVLQNLPSEIPPILIVQHIPPVFSAAFAKRLNDLLPFEVKEAADGDEISNNRVLIAPGGYQMGIQHFQNKLLVRIQDVPPVNRHKPSVDYLFSSFAKLKSRKAVAVLLTGMGADGARGMKELKDLGVRTLAQDKESCIVFGMPRAAIELNAALKVKPLDSMAEAIVAEFNEIQKASEKKAA